MKTPPTLIVTRHQGAVDWLAARGITGPVVAHADARTVRGRIVYGILPLYLLPETEQFWSIDLPLLPIDKRGAELTPEEMDSYGANLVGYKVIRLDPAP